MNQISLKNHFWILMLLIGLSSCQKEEYTFGSLTSPSGLTLNTTVVGVDAANPNGNGTGVVNINTAATSAITYKIDFGDGKVQMVPSGIISYKYTMPGINEYTITVTAVGTGGITTVVSKKIKVFVPKYDGEYCETCGERSFVCNCYPPEYRWKIKEK